MLSGATTYIDISNWIRINPDDLKTTVNLSWKRHPSKTSIQRVFAELKTLNLEKTFRDFSFKELELKSINPNIESIKSKYLHLAIDGKTLRGSYDNLQDTTTTIICF